MTIRELRRWIRGDPDYEAVCVRCSEHIADFSNPESVRDAVEASGGEIIKMTRDITDCVAACADCAGKCLCLVCGALLEDDVCPDCPEFIQLENT
jgi:hypothetical protein